MILYAKFSFQSPPPGGLGGLHSNNLKDSRVSSWGLGARDVGKVS